jgi:CDP-glycerol glycerophosphotransferase
MKIKDLILSLLSIIPGWLLIVPLSFLFKKQKGLTIVIGRDAHHFSDNTKYYYNFLATNYPKKSFFLYEKTNNYTNEIPNSIHYPSLKSIRLLLIAEFIVIDTSTWYRHFKPYFSFKAEKIQLWHGIGSKKIEMATRLFTSSKLKNLRKLYGILRGQLVKYKLVSSTSDYYTEHLYKDAFRYRDILPLGQPRNDIFFRTPDKLDLINTDKHIINNLIRKKAKENIRIVLYTPTFRKNLSLDLIDLKSLNVFAIEKKIIFVFKYHVLSEEIDLSNYSNIYQYNKQKDIYPLMSISDLMVTDYSSIYLDYIIQNKPILFFIPDFEDYKTSDTILREDFLEITPGTKCYTQDELHQAIIKELNIPNPEYEIQRKQILNLSYKFIDGNSSKRIYDYLNK